jgi:hypothetical protein
MLLAMSKVPWMQLQIFYFQIGENLVWLIHAQIWQLSCLSSFVAPFRFWFLLFFPYRSSFIPDLPLLYLTFVCHGYGSLQPAVCLCHSWFRFQFCLPPASALTSISTMFVFILRWFLPGYSPPLLSSNMLLKAVLVILSFSVNIPILL